MTYTGNQVIRVFRIILRNSYQIVQPGCHIVKYNKDKLPFLIKLQKSEHEKKAA